MTQSAADRSRRRLPLLGLGASLLVGLLALGRPAHADEPLPDEIHALSLPRAPAVDGDLADWPEGPSERLDRPDQLLPGRPSPWGGPTDLSATLRAGVHEETLYLALAIEDDRPFHPGEPWWHGDSVEVFFDFGLRPDAPRAESFGAGCWQVFLMPRNREMAWGVAFQGPRGRFDDGALHGVRVAGRERKGGYDLEAALPLANFVEHPLAARPVGFALALNDADTGASQPGTYMSWNGQFELYRSPDHFGTLYLPGRDASARALPASPLGSPLLWALLAVIVAIAGVLVLTGPAARAFARIGPAPKAIGLGLTGLLAVLFVVDAARTESRARDQVGASLAALADEADAVGEEAAAVGALDADDPEERAEVLASLLEGRRVPTVLPPQEVAFVPLRDLDEAAANPRLAYQLPLDRPRRFHLTRSVEAEAITLRVQVRSRAARDDEAPVPVVLGWLTPLPGDEAGGLPLTVDPSGAGTQVLELKPPDPGPWTSLGFKPAHDAPYAILRGLAVREADGTAAQVLLSTETEDGIPILGGEGTPDLGLVIPPGQSHRLSLPYLLGADRMWLVLTAPAAFPQLLRDDVVARLGVEYDVEPDPARDGDGPRGPEGAGREAGDAAFDLSNGRHLVAERLPPGIQRPPEKGTRTAYRWTDGRGLTRVHEALAIPLDPSRRAKHLAIENLGGAGPLRLVAATVIRAGMPPADSLLGITPGAANGADLVFAINPDPAFPARLGRGLENDVRIERQVGPEEAPTRVALSAPLPAAVAEKRKRTEVALYTCLAVALVLLAFLAADLVERLRHLTHRLALAVLVAALVPLGATILLLDRTTSDRLEAEHVTRARAALAAMQAALRESVRGTRDEARYLARHLGSFSERLDDEQTTRLVRLYREGALPPGTASLTLVTEADGPTLQIAGGGRAASLTGPRWLTERARATGLYVSPWDGLMLVGAARYGDDERWVRVALGVRADDAFLAGPARAALPTQDAAVGVVDAAGIPLATTGVDGREFLSAFARQAGDLRRRADTDALARVEPVSAGGRPRLAIWQRLDTAGPKGEAPYLVVGLDRTGIERTLAEQREHLAWLALFGVVLVVGVAGLTARRVAEPVEGLVRVTEAVRRGEFDVEVPPAGTDEVGDLTIAFDQMRHDLKHRVADLDCLRRAQETLAESLDHAHRVKTVVELMREAFHPDAVVLLDASSPAGPLTVVAEHGRSTTFGDRAFHGAEGGWLRTALETEEPIVISEPGRDERVAAEGGLGARLVEDKLAWIAAPLRTGRETAGLLVLAWNDPDALPRGAARRLLEPLAGVCALAVHNARLYRLAALDEVTRLPGATAFEAALRTDVERAAQGGPPVMLLRVGLDHVEHVTMRRGVELARDLLRSLGLALREVAGDRSRLGRLREDELAVRMPGATRAEALELAEAIRERLARVEVVPEAGGDPVGTTVTVGTACGPEDATSLEFLLDAAGRALAAARREGGDRVEDAARLDAGPRRRPALRGRHRGPQREDGARRRGGPARRAHRRLRAHHRRDRHRQGGHRQPHPPPERPAGAPVREGQLRGLPGDPARERAVRARARRLHRRRSPARGPLRARRRRHALPRRDRRDEPERAGEAPPRAPGAPVRPPRRHPHRQRRRPHHRGHEPRPRAGGGAGVFREDLYYRLNVIRLELPPLRERREEIPHLVDRFLIDAARRIGRGPQRLDPAAMDILYRHPWPGNVRELKNAIERCAVMCDSEVAGPEHLQLDGSSRGTGPAPRSAPRDDLNHRQRVLLDHLARHGRCTNREYYEMTSTSPRTGLRDLQDLMERGLLIREGKRRGAVYRLP